MEKENSASDMASPDDDNSSSSSPEEKNTSNSNNASEPKDTEAALPPRDKSSETSQKKGISRGKAFALGGALGGAATALGIFLYKKGKHKKKQGTVYRQPSSTRIRPPFKPPTNIPASLNTFAHELVYGGKSFAAVVEANNPLSRELNTVDVDALADAVAAKVLERLKNDPDFRDVVREEAASLKRTLPSNVLGSAVISGINMALALL